MNEESESGLSMNVGSAKGWSESGLSMKEGSRSSVKGWRKNANSRRGGREPGVTLLAHLPSPRVRRPRYPLPRRLRRTLEQERERILYLVRWRLRFDSHCLPGGLFLLNAPNPPNLDSSLHPYLIRRRYRRYHQEVEPQGLLPLLGATLLLFRPFLDRLSHHSSPRGRHRRPPMDLAPAARLDPNLWRGQKT